MLKHADLISPYDSLDKITIAQYAIEQNPNGVIVQHLNQLDRTGKASKEDTLKYQEILDELRNDNPKIFLTFAKEDYKWTSELCAKIVTLLQSARQEEAGKILLTFRKLDAENDAFNGKTLLQYAIENDAKGYFVKQSYLLEITRLISDGEQKQALDLMLKHDDLISPYDYFDDKTLAQYAIEQNPVGDFAKHCDTFDIVVARKLLEGTVPDTDPSILRTTTGFYKLTKVIGAGNFGSVHTALHYSLHDREVIVSLPVAIKKMGSSESAILDKEHDCFQKAYPDQSFERFTIGSDTYLSMPLVPGDQLDKYLVLPQDISHKKRLNMAADLFLNLQEIHNNGITHNDLKLQNILFDPATNKIQLIDFGCAENHDTHMQYENIYTSIFAFEMPPEYLTGTNSEPSLDVFSVTAIIAEILGIDKNAIVNARMLKALKDIDDPLLKADMIEAVKATSNLGDAFFHDLLIKHKDNPNLELFIKNYVSEPYDFSPYEGKLGTRIIDLLNAMQDQNPRNRPTTQKCLEQLRIVMSAAQEPVESSLDKTAAWRKALKELKPTPNLSPDASQSPSAASTDESASNPGTPNP